jgi:MscS family membrane protein
MVDLVEWLSAIDFGRAALGVVGLALVIALSSHLGHLICRLGTQGLQFLRIPVPEKLAHAVEDLARTLVITLALSVFFRLFALPDAALTIVDRLLWSVVVGHVFLTGYRLLADLIAGALPHQIIADRAWIVAILRGLAVLFAGASILHVWGINIGSVFAGVGVLGAGLAIALQDLIQNFAAGLSNAAEKRFRRGDWIEVGEVEGVIENIGIRSTVVMGFDRIPRHVPNSDLGHAVLLNKSRIDHWRIYWPIELVREATEDQVRAVCDHVRGYIQDSGRFVTDGTKTCFVKPTRLTENGIEILIYVFCNSSDWNDWLDAQAGLLSALRTAVAEAGTALAVQTRSVHLTQTDLSAPMQSSAYTNGH